MSGKPAIFLDRDGVINENPDKYVKSWDEFHFLPGALEAFRLLARLPWPIFIATNQSVVGRNIIFLQELEYIHTRMLSVIYANGGRVDGIYACPHTPEDGCNCRKPRPGLLEQAAKEHNINLKQSLMIGDSINDIEAAQAVLMPAVQIKYYHENSPRDSNSGSPLSNAYVFAESLLEITQALSDLHHSSARINYPSHLMVYFANRSKS